jgi:hypothetical protein
MALMVRHSDPCVTTVYDLMLEVDVVQRPRFGTKFSLSSTACVPLDFFEQCIISFYHISLGWIFV